MTAVSTGIDTSRLTPSEVEELHIHLATAASLNDTNIPTESIISNILSGRDEPVPLYTAEGGSTIEQDAGIRKRIAARDGKIWASIYSVIKNGNIEALDHFVKLGLDINLPHPLLMDFPIVVAVKEGQTNMMRHLINLGADVNVWSPRPRGYGYPGKLDDRCETSRTPLMCAAEQGSLNICKILCETAFADPMLIALDGQTAQRIAARNGHKEIVEYLPAHRGGVWLRLKCISSLIVVNGR
jgi:ankyrin repeat protein